MSFQSNNFKNLTPDQIIILDLEKTYFKIFSKFFKDPFFTKGLRDIERYIKKNKVFLLSLKRSKVESKDKDKKVNSICKFDFVDSVKSKNINQEDIDQKLELIAMEYIKNNENYEINLIFTNNAYITLSTEIIEVTLDDQNKID